MIFWTTYIAIKNFLFCTVLPPGASKIDQIKTFYGVIKNNCVRFKKSSSLRVWSSLEAPGGKTVQNKNFSWRYKLFKIPFLTTFVSMKTLYDQIWNIFVDQIYLFLGFFHEFEILRTKLHIMCKLNLCQLSLWNSICIHDKRSFLK